MSEFPESRRLIHRKDRDDPMGRAMVVVALAILIGSVLWLFPVWPR